ncbi:hypothetical protein BQ8794_100050 [Mesorhizobium prunaredense]|uniref:Uncharacterized protein n=2 Tax=Mesorhizobium prunaredense TaxID=1631249 RepID=A0A1R3UZU0_9HYPH|nr:hypothetical protein BQ8794_100050 [Mesorhizobium prunaredense]
MQRPPEIERPATPLARTGPEMSSLAATDRPENNPSLSVEQAVPGDVVAAVRVARTSLVSAQFRLDDHGYHCRLLDGLNDGAATLLAEWAGRRRPSIAEELSPYVIKAAIEWRQARAKRWRP